MEHLVKKVIMASAGTGKTYRLSLEFIALLLKYKDYEEFDFSQIVVMTFTRKATAEIREKILDFLNEIANSGPESSVIIANLEKISGYKWQSSDKEYIKNKLLKDILQRKDLLQVSTIDSFTTNIFKSMIAPYLRIKEFSIDNNANDDIMPQLLNHIFSEQFFPLFQPLLTRIKIRTVEGAQGFIESLINFRWILDYYENGMMEGTFCQASKLSYTLLEEIKEKNWQSFKDEYLGLIEDYNNLVYAPQDKPWHKLIINDYKKLFAVSQEEENISITQIFTSLLSDSQNFAKHLDLFIQKPLPFVKKGKKNFVEITKELETSFQKLIPSFADYYLIAEIIPKQQEILAGWRNLCEEYDRLKFGLGKFTYNDITFYTYKYLYDESLSLIDREEGIVTNLFYEQLVSRIRFLLIDEFQDTSFNQFSILIPIINELLSGYSVKDYSGVIIVGDPKQSIYGWRGGERGIMEIMPKKLKIKAEDLSQCFRSTRPVIDIINHIFTDGEFQKSCSDSNIKWIYTPVQAKNWDQATQSYNELKEDGGELFYWEYNQITAKMDNEDYGNEDSLDSEDNKNLAISYEKFANQILELHKTGQITWGETAILVRKHKHANNIAKELNKLNIPNNIESSGKLLEHKAVELLLAIMKFKLLKDRYSFLRILRSDLILLEPSVLKEILKFYNNSGNELTREEEFSYLRKFPQVAQIIDIISNDYLSYSHFLRVIISSYDFSKVCQNEIDWKNIYAFLELLIKFELAKINSNTFDLYSFIEYCQQQLQRDSEILQEGLQLENSISILTVHKSKGLGYKNVFIYWELSNRTAPNKGEEFKMAYSFNKDTYLTLKDFIVYSSSKDEKALKYSNSSELMEDFSERDIIEAIDVFYVALTRAEERLGLFFSYSSKSDSLDFMDSLKNEAGVIGKLITAYKNYFRIMEGDIISKDNLISYSYKIPSKKLLKDAKKIQVLPNQPNYLKSFLTDYSLPAFEENRPIENLKKVYLDDRHQLYGNVAHEFLAYIKYFPGEDIQFKIAKNMVYRKYGSLLAKNDLDKIFQNCLNFLEANREIFSPQWDKVFNEKTVFHNSKEYRIDRMMINSSTKEILIIDYKTGNIDDADQVNHYIEIIKDLPYVKMNDYKVTGKFLALFLDV